MVVNENRGKSELTDNKIFPQKMIKVKLIDGRSPKLAYQPTLMGDAISTKASQMQEPEKPKKLHIKLCGSKTGICSTSLELTDQNSFVLVMQALKELKSCWQNAGQL